MHATKILLPFFLSTAVLANSMRARQLGTTKAGVARDSLDHLFKRRTCMDVACTNRGGVDTACTHAICGACGRDGRCDDVGFSPSPPSSPDPPSPDSGYGDKSRLNAGTYGKPPGASKHAPKVEGSKIAAVGPATPKIAGAPKPTGQKGANKMPGQKHKKRAMGRRHGFVKRC